MDNKATKARQTAARAGFLRRHAVAALLLFGILLVCLPGKASDLVMTESQVKALCVLNFAKYVSWPAAAFESQETPIRIGIAGQPALEKDLRSAATGRVIDGRSLEVVSLDDPKKARACHIIFLGAVDKPFRSEIATMKQAPLLTVRDRVAGEAERAIIQFVMRESKVRFEVDLAGARAAGLQVSSKLLTLADKVHGK